jgi:hypothetical protein
MTPESKYSLGAVHLAITNVRDDADPNLDRSSAAFGNNLNSA